MARSREDRRWDSLLATQVVALLALSTIGGCGPETPESAFQVVDSAGITLADNASPAWPLEGQPWRLTPQPLATVGTRNGPEAQQLYVVVDAARTPDGGIVVANAGSRELRFYDATGQHIRSVGGEGEGPGEFLGMRGISVVGDSILAFDNRLERISTFDLSGEFRGSVRLEQPDSVLLLRYGLAGVVGNTIVLAPIGFRRQETTKAEVVLDSAPTLKYDRTGRLLGQFPEPAVFELYAEPDGTSFRPFGKFTSSDVGRGRLAMGDGGGFEVHLYDEEGSLSEIIRRPYEPQPVTEDDIEALLRARMELYGVGPDDPRLARLRLSLETIPMPSRIPAYSQLVFADNGYLWVQEYRPPEDATTKTWDVFRDDGRWLGPVEIPGRHVLFDIGEDYVMGVWRDNEGVETVRVYGIRGP